MPLCIFEIHVIASNIDNKIKKYSIFQFIKREKLVRDNEQF